MDEPSTALAAALTILAIAGLFAWQIADVGLEFAEWDYLFLSGCLTAIAGLWLARGQPGRFSAMFERLANRNALRHDPELSRGDVAGLRRAMRDRGRDWAARGGVVVGAGLAILWLIANARTGARHGIVEELGGPLVGGFVGYLVGRVLGRMLAYALLGPFLQRRGVTFRPDPEHVDGAAGLKPLGDYYLYQALLLALPAVFLLFWSLMFALPEWSERYGAWREPYLGLLAVAILLEVVAFVAPMWHAHGEMAKAKREALVTVDTTLARDIAEARGRLESDLTPDERAAAADRLERLLARYDAIEGMPTWPVDHAVRRRVTLGNAALVVGLVGQAAALSGWS